MHFSGFYAIQNGNELFKVKDQLNETQYQINYGRIIHIVSLKVIDERFIEIRMLNGSPYPRPATVINAKTYKEEDNPRSRNQFEPSNCFALIDFTTNIIWLSHTRKKEIVIKFLEKFKIYDLILKDVYSKEEFVAAIKKIDTIKLSVVPNLLNSEFNLSDHLQTDIYGYGAEEASIEFKFKNKPIKDYTRDFISNILRHKENFKYLMITGRNDDNLGMILNKNIFSRKIDIDVEYDEDDNIIDKESIISLLINKINDETKASK